MLSAFAASFFALSILDCSNGGTFLWVQLPASLPMSEICQQQLRNYFHCGGNTIFPGQQGCPALRLNFTLSPDKIERGISVLEKC